MHDARTVATVDYPTPGSLDRTTWKDVLQLASDSLDNIPYKLKSTKARAFLSNVFSAHTLYVITNCDNMASPITTMVLVQQISLSKWSGSVIVGPAGIVHPGRRPKSERCKEPERTQCQ